MVDVIEQAASGSGNPRVERWETAAFRRIWAVQVQKVTGDIASYNESDRSGITRLAWVVDPLRGEWSYWLESVKRLRARWLRENPF
jgi:hypothetical protein